MNLDADKKLLDGLRQLKDHLYGRVCELRDELREELRQSMTVSPKMKKFYQLIRRCKRVNAQVKRLAPKVRMAQLRFDMLTDPKWRRRVIDDLGGEKALQSWERRMDRLNAPKGELWAEKKLYSAYVPAVGELTKEKSDPPSRLHAEAPSPHWGGRNNGLTSHKFALSHGDLRRAPSVRARRKVARRVGRGGQSVRNRYDVIDCNGVPNAPARSADPKIDTPCRFPYGYSPNHKNLLQKDRKPKPFDYSGITSNPLTVTDPCKLDREGYFRLAAIPRETKENRVERKAEPLPDWYKQKIIDLRKARAEQLKRFGREGLKPIPLTPKELREGIIIPFRQAKLNRAAQPEAEVYTYDNDNWGNVPKDAVAPKARSPSVGRLSGA